jgi:hypothetical protein
MTKVFPTRPSVSMTFWKLSEKKLGVGKNDCDNLLDKPYLFMDDESKNIRLSLVQGFWENQMKISILHHAYVKYWS